MKYISLFFKKLLRYLLKPLSFLPAIFVMYVIYYLSAQDGATSAGISLKVSVRIADLINRFFDKGLTPEQVLLYADQIHFYVRKLGHVTEYFILAVTVAIPFYVYRIRGFWLFFLAGLFCVGFAGLDEYHQSFVAGRGPSPRDVCIDSIGIFSGILLTQFCCFIARKTIFAPLALPKSRKA